MDCPACSVWVRVQDGIRDALHRATLEALVSTPRRNGRVASHGYVEVGNLLAPA
jgi:DNA-binding IscR family transcriptional regulator